MNRLSREVALRLKTHVVAGPRQSGTSSTRKVVQTSVLNGPPIDKFRRDCGYHPTNIGSLMPRNPAKKNSTFVNVISPTENKSKNIFMTAASLATSESSNGTA